MAAPLKIEKQAARNRLPPDDLILKLLNELQTPQAVASQLNVHPRTVNRYIKPRFERRCVWTRKSAVIDADVIAEVQQGSSR